MQETVVGCLQNQHTIFTLVFDERENRIDRTGELVRPQVHREPLTPSKLGAVVGKTGATLDHVAQDHPSGLQDLFLAHHYWHAVLLWFDGCLGYTLKTEYLIYCDMSNRTMRITIYIKKDSARGRVSWVCV